jgi:hypothetical protein
VVCSQDHVRLRTKARTCAELVLMSKVATLPGECLDKVRVGNCFRQEYIINGGVYYFFSPYEDDIHYRCASYSGKFSVGKGLTMINITECDLQSSEVLIKRKYVDGPVVKLTDDIQIFATLSDMSKILSELEPIREVSMENDSALLRKFLHSKDTESVALEAAAVDLRNFWRIEGLTNYTILDFNPSAPLGIGNSITGAYAGLMLITLILTFGCCCACKCCRSCCTDMLFLVYKLIRWLLMSSFEGASWLYSRGQAWCASKKAASEELEGAEESCPLEYSIEAEEMHNVVFTSPIDSGVGDCIRMKSKLGRLNNWPRANSLTLDTSRVEQGENRQGRTSTPKQPGGGGNEVIYADVSFIPQSVEEHSLLVRGRSEDNIPRSPHGDRSVSQEQLAEGWRLDRSGCSRLLLVKDRSCEELTWNDYKSAVFNSLGYEVSCKPPARVISRYREELSQLRYPEKVLVNGVWTLPEYPGIVWEDGKYIDTSSPDKRQACGFKDDLYLCRRSLEEVDRIGLA